QRFTPQHRALPQGTFVGSQLSLRPSLRESNDLMSSSEMSKSNTWLFSRIRSSLVDLGITTSLCCIPQRIMSWAGVFEYFVAREIILGCLNLCPLARGERFKHPRIISLATKYSKTPAQLMIRWGIQQRLVVIPKSTREERIRENSQVFDFDISDDDMRSLDSLNEGLRLNWD